MQNSRQQRRAHERAKRQRLVWLLVAVASLAALVTLVALGFGAWQSWGPKSPAKGEGSAVAVSETSEAATVPTNDVEVPDFSGLTPDEAEAVAEAAGLKLVIRVEGSAVDSSASVKVRNQVPEAGAAGKAGDAIEVVVPPLLFTKPGSAQTSAAQSPRGNGFVVVIDPGHQAHGDNTPEPIGPGSSQTKPAVTSGATGVATGREEHAVVLEISKRLAADLRAAGVTVIMTREKADVSLSNSQRAKIANDAKADLFIRVHADSIDDSSRTGISTLVPGANSWTGPILVASEKAGKAVQRAVVGATGARDRGVVERTDMSGFNWAKVPSVIVETGFLSNPAEDRRLSQPSYQAKLARGMADGVLAYLETTR